MALLRSNNCIDISSLNGRASLAIKEQIGRKGRDIFYLLSNIRPMVALAAKIPILYSAKADNCQVSKSAQTFLTDCSSIRTVIVN